MNIKYISAKITGRNDTGTEVIIVQKKKKKLL